TKRRQGGSVAGRIRAVDSLINSSFLDLTGEGGSGTLSHLFPDIESRPSFEDPEAMLEYLDGLDIGACVISIMEPGHAEWVAEAHRRFPWKVLPAMIVDPTLGMSEVRKVVEYHERYGVRCLRI